MVVFVSTQSQGIIWQQLEKIAATRRKRRE